MNSPFKSGIRTFMYRGKFNEYFPYSKSHFWETPLNFKKNISSDTEWGDLWRKVKKVVVHSEFISEELSWKGWFTRIKPVEILL